MKRAAVSKNAATVVLGVIAPISIYITLAILNSVTLTFFVFYIGVCTLIPFFNLVVINRESPSKILYGLGLSFSHQALRSGIVTGILFGSIIIGFFTLFKGLLIDEDHVRAILLRWGIGREATLPLTAVLIFANPLFEEFYWRGFILHRFRGKVRPATAIVCSALFYASYHFITTGFIFSFRYGLFLSLVVFFVGLIWGVMRERTGSLLSCFIGHLLADAGIMAVYLLYIVHLLPESGI